MGDDAAIGSVPPGQDAAASANTGTPGPDIATNDLLPVDDNSCSTVLVRARSPQSPPADTLPAS